MVLKYHIKMMLVYLQMIVIVVFATVNANIKIIDQTYKSITLEINVDKLQRITKKVNGHSYDIINIAKFGKLSAIGKPALPYRGINIATLKDSEIKITILDKEIEFINTVTLYPDQGPDVISPKDYLIKKDFKIDSKFYAEDADYPKEPIYKIRDGIIKGTNITTIGIVPVQYNPKRKLLKVLKKMVVRIDYTIPDSRSLSHQSMKTIKNLTINSLNIKRDGRDENPQGVLIITKNDYQSAAIKLAKWQKQKGYNVEIDSRATWTAYEVGEKIKSWYNIDSIDASYLLLLGDLEDIPSHGTITKTAYSTYTGPTDHYYTCLDGNDYYGDIARGRITASYEAEANNAVDKIIRFEKNPPLLDSYYKQTLGAAFLQDNDKNEWWPENAYGYADRRFAQTIEEINLYLEEKGYNFNRVFNTNAVVVNKWNLGKYSWGEPVPDYLKPPQFNWDGETADILNTLNSGAFLAYHYDHGMQDGWADPAFTVNDIPLLTNDSILPIIYSINCLTGKFNHETKCFAERQLGDSAIGAAGIVAATNLSYSGWNEAFLLGMIDATWPGISLSTPNTENPTVTEHEPVYKIGDIMNQGLFRMTETWTNTYSEDYDEYHFKLYHYFGDPTTRIWTKVPDILTPSHSMTINPKDSLFKLAVSDVNEGIATLYDIKNDVVTGRVTLGFRNAEISLPEDLVIGDTLLLTITGQDVRPYVKHITITNDITENKLNLLPWKNQVQVINNILFLNNSEHTNYSIDVYDLRGRIAYKSLVNSKNKKSVDLRKLSLSKGNYFIKVKDAENAFFKRFTLLD